MPTKPLTLNVEFQGFPCSPLFEIRRSPGLDPDYSFVHVAKQDLGEITIQDPPGGFQKAIQQLADLSAPTGKNKLYTVGDVLVQDLEDSVEGATIRFRHMLLDESSIEAVVATDATTDGLVRIGLRDIRALWADQGMVNAWVNVARQSTWVDPANPLATADQQRFTPGSMDGGSAWTIRRVLEKIILPALPGKPTLTKLSDSLEKRESAPHKWECKRARDCFEEVLAEVDAVCVLNPDASVSVWRRGDGPLQSADGKEIAADDDSIASRTLLLSHRSTVPDTVLVVGRPIVETKTVALVAVGEVSQGGFPPQLVPLSQAFSMTSIPPSASSRAILLGHDERLSAGIPDSAVHGYERWAFRWFVLPSFFTGQKTEVPVEPCAETDSDGQRLPPIVRSQGVRSARVRLATSGKGSGTTTAAGAADVDVVTRQLVTNETELQGVFASGDKEAIAAVVEVRLALSKKLADLIGPRASQSSLIPANVNLVGVNPDSNLIIYNVPLSAQPNEGSYKIDTRRGLVEFTSPRLQVTTEGISVDEAEVKPATVTLTFGVSRKPAPDQPLKLSDRYFSMWKFFGSHGPESEDLKQVGDSLGSALVTKATPDEVAAVDLSSVVVVEADLQLLVTLDKRDNRAALDSIAQSLAEPLILANRFVPGAVIDLVGISDVVPTGRILSVVWSGSVNEPPKTVAHDGAPAPLRAAPRRVSLDDLRKSVGRVGVESVGTSSLGYLPGSR